jgi:hypothetical protein
MGEVSGPASGSYGGLQDQRVRESAQDQLEIAAGSAGRSTALREVRDDEPGQDERHGKSHAKPCRRP